MSPPLNDKELVGEAVVVNEDVGFPLLLGSDVDVAVMFPPSSMALTFAHNELQMEKSISPIALELPKIIPGVFEPVDVILNCRHGIASVDGVPFSAMAVHKLIISSLNFRSSCELLQV